MWDAIQHTQEKLNWFENRKAAANHFYRIEIPKLKARVNQVVNKFTKICPEIEDRFHRPKRGAPMILVGNIMRLIFHLFLQKDKENFIKILIFFNKANLRHNDRER